MEAEEMTKNDIRTKAKGTVKRKRYDAGGSGGTVRGL